MTLNDLLSSYGWQLALVALLGTILVGLLKKPFNALIRKGKEGESSAEQKFDVVAFLLGLVIAFALGATYSALAQYFNWLKNTDEQTVVVYNFAIYLSNGFGTWLYQILYYQIWKKLGVKNVWEIIKKAVVKAFDKNKNGKFDIDEAATVVLGMLKNGKLSIDEVISTVTATVPEVAQDVVDKVTEEAGELGKVDEEDAIAKLDKITAQLLAGIPEGKLSALTSTLVDKASKKVKEVAENPAPVPDSAAVQEPKRPTVKF